MQKYEVEENENTFKCVSFQNVSCRSSTTQRGIRTPGDYITGTVPQFSTPYSSNHAFMCCVLWGTIMSEIKYIGEGGLIKPLMNYLIYSFTYSPYLHFFTL